MERWATKKASAVRGEVPWFLPGSEREIRAYKEAAFVTSNHSRTTLDDMKLVSHYQAITAAYLGFGASVEPE